jgi:hypothetical protein
MYEDSLSDIPLHTVAATDRIRSNNKVKNKLKP